MLWREKEKNPIFVYRGLRYTHKKINFACKTIFFQKTFVWVRKSICGWKNTKSFWGRFKKVLKYFCRRHQKSASLTFSTYGSCIISIFLTKKFSFLFSTIHRIFCHNKRKIFRKLDDTILAKCMKFVWVVFFRRLSSWNCMSIIFGLWI